MTNAPAIVEADRVSVPPWVRLRYCQVRRQWLLLAPEKVLFPCPTSRLLLERLDGRPMAAVIDQLAADFGEDRAIISADVLPLLTELAGQGVLEVGRDG